MIKDRSFTLAEVAQHRSKKDLYIISENKVYDVTPFIDEHPGGEDVILRVAGQDATEAFHEVGHSKEAKDQLAELLIGVLDMASETTVTSPQSMRRTSRKRGVSSSMMLCGLAVATGAAAFVAYKYVSVDQ